MSQLPELTPSPEPSLPGRGESATATTASAIRTKEAPQETEPVETLAIPTLTCLPAAQETESRSPPVPLWLVALALAGVALIAVQIPYGRIPTLVLGVAGLAVAGVSLLLEDRRWAAGGMALNGLLLLVTLFLPSWLGLQPWRGGGSEEEVAGPVLVEFNLNRATAGMTRPRPLAPEEWIDASRGAWQQGDARVYVASVRIAPVELENPSKKQQPKERRLQIGLNVSNVGVARTINYRPFDERGKPEDPPLKLKDGEGLAISPVDSSAASPVLGKSRGGPIGFRGSIEDLLIFELPQGRWEQLSLELPAASVDQPGIIRFKISRTMLSSGRESLRGLPPG
jgi:hypothetical protein